MTKNERIWAMSCHLSSLVIMFLPGGNIIGPLSIWLFKGNEMPLVEAQAKESLNFQISMTIFFLFAFLLSYIWIGRPLILLLFLTDIIMVIWATITVYKGKPHLYLINFRLIK